MNTNNPSIIDRDMSEALSTLSRSVRRQRFALAALIGVIAGSMLAGVGSTGQPSRNDPVLKAERIEIVNPRGETMLVLSHSNDAGTISLQDRDGKHLITLAATPDGAGLIAIRNRSGDRLLELTGRKDQSSGILNVFNELQEVVVAITSSQSAGVVQTFHRRHPSVLLGNVDGTGTVAVFGADGRLVNRLTGE